MKTKITLVLLLLSSYIYSQKLSYEDLKYCLDNSIDEVDMYLSDKDYEFSSHKTDDVCSSTSWAYDRQAETGLAKAFIGKLCDESKYSTITYNPNNQDDFELVRKECLNLDFKLFEKDYDEETKQLSFIYRNDTYRITFSKGINEKGVNYYLISYSRRYDL